MTTYRRLFGESVPADEAFEAWTGRDLGRMVAALPLATNGLDRHFLYMGIVEEAFRRRADSDMAELCERYAREHIAAYSQLRIDLLRQDPQFGWPFSARQRLCDLLLQQGRTLDYVVACREAYAATHAPYFAERLGYCERFDWESLRSAIQQRPGVSQTQFCDEFDQGDRDEVRTILYWAEKRGDLLRVKRGRTYALYLP